MSVVSRLLGHSSTDITEKGMRTSCRKPFLQNWTSWVAIWRNWNFSDSISEI